MPGSSGTASPIPGTPTSNFQDEPIKHPAGYEVKIDIPLDWAGVTDHSEYVGVIMHRNIFFKDCAKVPPMPFSALHSPFSEELW